MSDYDKVERAATMLREAAGVELARIVTDHMGLPAPVLYQHCKHCLPQPCSTPHTMRCAAEGCRQGRRVVGKPFIQVLPERSSELRVYSPIRWWVYRPSGGVVSMSGSTPLSHVIDLVVATC